MGNDSEVVIASEVLPDGSRHYRVAGSLTRQTINRIKKSIPAGGPGVPVSLDLSAVDDFDSFGAVFILERAAASAGHFSVGGASEELRDFVCRLARFGRGAPIERETLSFLEGLGQSVFRWKDAVRDFLELGFEFFYWFGVAPFKGGRLYTSRIFGEIVAAGVDAIPIVLLTSVLIGVILALNAAAQLEMFGATIFVADLVGVALTKELGPVFTAILVAGRTGSAIAAELGTMVVTEELDALQVMGINPRAFLVVPKILALLIIMPCLVIMADILGICGGLMISVSVLDLSFADYMNQTVKALHVSHILTGLFKSTVFGFLIGLTGATLGLRLRGGAEEVGRITTASVVLSFLLIIVADTIFTVIFAYMGY